MERPKDQKEACEHSLVVYNRNPVGWTPKNAVSSAIKTAVATDLVVG